MIFKEYPLSSSISSPNSTSSPCSPCPWLRTALTASGKFGRLKLVLRLEVALLLLVGRGGGFPKEVRRGSGDLSSSRAEEESAGEVGLEYDAFEGERDRVSKLKGGMSTKE